MGRRIPPLNMFDVEQSSLRAKSLGRIGSAIPCTAKAARAGTGTRVIDGGNITVNFPFFGMKQCKSMVILRDFPFEFVIMTCAEKQVFLCFPFQWGINGCLHVV